MVQNCTTKHISKSQGDSPPPQKLMVLGLKIIGEGISPTTAVSLLLITAVLVKMLVYHWISQPQTLFYEHEQRESHEQCVPGSLVFSSMRPTAGHGSIMCSENYGVTSGLLTKL